MKRRIALIILIVVAALLVVREVADLWFAHKVNQELAALEKKYGEMTTGSMNPPDIPEAENRARLMRGASMLTASLHDMASFRLPRDLWLPAAQRPAEFAGYLRQLVERNRLAASVAEQGLKMPNASWELSFWPYGEPSHMPAIWELRQLGNVMAARCVVDSEEGRIDSAIGAALVGLSEASSLRNEWATTLQLFRVQIATTQLACIRTMLENGEPSAASLSQVAEALTDSRWPDPIRMALIGELKRANAAYVGTETGKGIEYMNDMHRNRRPFWAQPSVFWLFRPVVRYVHLRNLRALDRIIELQAVEPYRRDASQAAEWSKYVYAPHPSDRGVGPGSAMPWWQFSVRPINVDFGNASRARLADVGYEYQSALNDATVAVAARRFRLDRSKYPDTLAELVPTYLPWIPIDPYTGKTPDYSKQGAGFELRAHRNPRRSIMGADVRAFDWKIAR